MLSSRFVISAAAAVAFAAGAASAGDGTLPVRMTGYTYTVGTLANEMFTTSFAVEETRRLRKGDEPCEGEDGPGIPIGGTLSAGPNGTYELLAVCGSGSDLTLVAEHRFPSGPLKRVRLKGKLAMQGDHVVFAGSILLPSGTNSYAFKLFAFTGSVGWQRQVAPILQRHCGSCHGGRQAPPDISDKESVQEAFDIIVSRAQSHFPMPDDDFKVLLNWRDANFPD